MGVVDGFRNRAQQRGGLACRHRAVGGQTLRQAAPTHQLHREEDQPGVLAHLVHDDDVGMLQQCRVLRFAAQAVDQLLRCQMARRQQLDRHLAAEVSLARTIDAAHAATPDLFDQFVVAELALHRIAEIHSRDLVVERSARRHRGRRRVAGIRAKRKLRQRRIQPPAPSDARALGESGLCDAGVGGRNHGDRSMAAT